MLVVSGVMGVEVQTSRIWKRAEELGLARCLVVNMLDRERADFVRVLSQLQAQLSPHCVAIQVPIGAEHELKGVVDLLHLKAYMSPEGGKEAAPAEIPAEIADTVAAQREKLLDAIAETDEALMERYLEGEEIGGEELTRALEQAILRGEVFPVACAVATKNLGSTALLDLLVRVHAVAGTRRALRAASTRWAPAPSSSRRSPIRSPGASTSSASSAAPSSPTRRSPTRARAARSAWASCC